MSEGWEGEGWGGEGGGELVECKFLKVFISKTRIPLNRDAKLEISVNSVLYT